MKQIQKDQMEKLFDIDINEGHKFPYQWTLKDANFTKDKGKVFSCFACGGGSTMGYKLAGFDVLGCNEIDKNIIKIYEANHHPKYSYCESIVNFKKRDDLPEELFHLDILDGSPPCTPFSLAGQREKTWGVKKKFAEGQTEQVLDTLFFDFIDLAKRLQSKIVVAENVEGLLLKNAREYLRRIFKEFQDAGYRANGFLLNSKYMGVPQQRKRFFIIATRNDLPLFTDTMTFNEKPILLEEFADYDGRHLRETTEIYKTWMHRQKGERHFSETKIRVFNKNNNFNLYYLYKDRVCNTIIADHEHVYFDVPKYMSNHDIICASSFPLDYDFCGRKSVFICGMCVPPVMMANIASRIYDNYLSKI